jgi:hypothetical protein
MEDDPLDDSIVLKPKKPRSAAQLAAFEKAQQKRLANALLKKEALEKAKNDIVVEREKTKKVYKPKAKAEAEEEEEPKVEEKPKSTPTPLKTDQPPVKKPVLRKEPKIIYESESEDDVVIVKKKKKKPKVVYEESSSEDEEPVPRKKPAKKAEPVVAPVAIKPVIKFF